MADILISAFRSFRSAARHSFPSLGWKIIKRGIIFTDLAIGQPCLLWDGTFHPSLGWEYIYPVSHWRSPLLAGCL